MPKARGLRWTHLPQPKQATARLAAKPCRERLPDNRPTEYEHQVELIKQCSSFAYQYPGLELINASANGGLRKRGVAGQLKAMGVRDGFPDLNLPVARGGYLSLYIELKRPKTGRPSDNQIWWRDQLRRQGHCAEIIWGWEAAWDWIVAYYRMPATRIVCPPGLHDRRAEQL